MLERSKPELVVLEASGGYEIAALEGLLTKKIAVALLNPRHVRSLPERADVWPRLTSLTQRYSHTLPT
jgi:transposase